MAVFLPIESYRDLADSEGRSLLKARSALADLDSEVGKMCRDIYSERENEKDRRVIF